MLLPVGAALGLRGAFQACLHRTPIAIRVGDSLPARVAPHSRQLRTQVQRDPSVLAPGPRVVACGRCHQTHELAAERTADLIANVVVAHGEPWPRTSERLPWGQGRTGALAARGYEGKVPRGSDPVHRLAFRPRARRVAGEGSGFVRSRALAGTIG